MGLNLNNYIWLSLLLTTLVTLALWRYAYHSKLAIHDDSSDRSLHEGKALTGAGVFMFVPWVVIGLLLAPVFVPLYVVLVLSVLGFIDDRYDLSFKLRLVVQLVGAVVTLMSFGFFVPWWLGLFLTLSLIWWVNLFNFMDGANGMAGFHGLISIGFYGLLFLDLYGQANILNYMALGAVLILVVYLVFNLGLKKLFMGDSGSLPLAWIIATLALFGLKTGALNYLQVAVIHAVFIIDATFTLIIRLRLKEAVTQAHASHHYQRFIKLGFSHFKVSGVYALITLLCCLLVWLNREATMVVQWLMLLGVYACLSVVFIKYLKIGR